MNVIHAPAELKPGTRGVCVAIGVFDGVHLGHQAVIGQAREEARRQNALCVVVTFDRHPNSIVAPHRVPPLIYPLSKKLRVLESLAIDTTCVIPFDQPFSQISGDDFIRNLAHDFQNIRCVAVGETFMYGCKRSGDVASLRALGQELSFTVHALPGVSFNGQPVSSTRIREAVRAGRLDLASQLLGRPYSLCGMVKKGEQLGRKLGFPTANLEMTNILVPPSGVYAADAHVRGKTFRAAVNIGHRPTIQASDPVLHVEAHLLDFAEDIYGLEIELTFLKKIRDEQKFPTLSALQGQIEKDVAESRSL